MKEILVKMPGDHELVCEYNMELLELLKADPSVVEIIDTETEEVLYQA